MRTTRLQKGAGLALACFLLAAGCVGQTPTGVASPASARLADQHRIDALRTRSKVFYTVALAGLGAGSYAIFHGERLSSFDTESQLMWWMTLAAATALPVTLGIRDQLAAGSLEDSLEDSMAPAEVPPERLCTRHLQPVPCEPSRGTRLARP